MLLCVGTGGNKGLAYDSHAAADRAFKITL